MDKKMPQQQQPPPEDSAAGFGGIKRENIRTMKKDLAHLQQGVSAEPVTPGGKPSRAEAVLPQEPPRPGMENLAPEERIVSREADVKGLQHPPPGHEDVLFPELHPLAQVGSKPGETPPLKKPEEAPKKEPAAPRKELPPPALEKVLERREEPTVTPKKIAPLAREEKPGSKPIESPVKETPAPKKEKASFEEPGKKEKPAPKKETPSLEKILEEGKEEEKPTGRGSKRRLWISIAAVAVVLFGGGFAAWWFLFGQEPVEPPPESPPPPPPEVEIPAPTLPAALIRVEETQTIPIAEIGQAEAAVVKALGLPQPQNRTTRFLVLLETTPQRYLATEELSRAAGILLPTAVVAELETEGAMIFLVPQDEDGIRVGFAAQTRDRDRLREALAEWEPEMERDLSRFLASVRKTGTAATTTFQDNTYLGRSIRYKNFPTPDIAIDYTVDQKANIFLLATSRASMYAAIDRLP